jgi:hypothetical protein
MESRSIASENHVIMAVINWESAGCLADSSRHIFLALFLITSMAIEEVQDGEWEDPYFKLPVYVTEVQMDHF